MLSLATFDIRILLASGVSPVRVLETPWPEPNFITIISAKIISNYYKAMLDVGKADMLSARILSMFMHHINTKLGG
jgi:hypothetical protein